MTGHLLRRDQRSDLERECEVLFDRLVAPISTVEDDEDDDADDNDESLD